MTFNFAISGFDAGQRPIDPARRIAGVLGELVRRLRQSRDLSCRARHLRQLDDRLLLDIGISRGAIDHAVRLGR